jgi:hypothetical protein
MVMWHQLGQEGCVIALDTVCNFVQPERIKKRGVGVLENRNQQEEPSNGKECSKTPTEEYPNLKEPPTREPFRFIVVGSQHHLGQPRIPFRALSVDPPKHPAGEEDQEETEKEEHRRYDVGVIATAYGIAVRTAHGEYRQRQEYLHEGILQH